MNNQDDVKITKKILNEYFDNELEPEVNELVQGWLVNEDKREIKDQELRNKFFEKVKRDKRPGKKTFESLREIHNILGFPVRKMAMIRLRYVRVMNVAAVLVPLLIIAGALTIYLNKDITTVPVGGDANYIAETETGTLENREIVVEAGDEKIELTLPDGSQVWMGENSVLSYAENFEENRVVSLEGEAYFAVMERNQTVFEVKTDQLTVRVLGTEFFVKTDVEGGQTEVALASGKVEVVSQRNDVVYELSPQEQLLLDKLTLDAVKIEVPVEYITSKKTTETSTSSLLSLTQVFANVARAYNVKFAVDNSIAKDILIRIQVDNSLPLEELMMIIQAVAEPSFDFEIEGDTVRILSK